jgi:hypothetical protein
LQGEDLYAIKLYKGRNEFVQFVPERETPLKLFPLKGLHIQVKAKKKCNRCHATKVLHENIYTVGLFGSLSSLVPFA